MTPRLSQQWSLRSRSGHTTSHHEICGSGWTMHCWRHLQGWDNMMIADHLAAWLPDVFRPWLSMRTLRRWLDEKKKEGLEPRDAVDAIIPILREKCDRLARQGPRLRVCGAAIFNRVAHRHAWHADSASGGSATSSAAPASGIAPRQAGPRRRRTQNGGQHVDKLRLCLMYYVTEYGVHPSCIMNMDETAANGWASPKQDGRVRFIGATDKRNLTISTVVTMKGTIMAQIIVEGATKRVVQDLLQHENISYTFSESHWCTESTCQELIEWLKTRVLALGAAVGLCLCPSKGLPAGMDPYCSSGVRVATQRSYSQQTSRSSSLSSTASNSRPCNSLPNPCAGTRRCLTFASAP